MKAIYSILPGIFLGMALFQAHAVTIYECVDDEGNSVFQDRCPPGTTPAGEKKFRTGSGDEPVITSTDGNIPPDAEITLYSAPDCDACFILRGVLEQYGAIFSEKNINLSDEVKLELQEKMGGAGTLTIPTIIIDEKIIAGFKKDELINTLESTGYTKPGAGENPAEEISPEETVPESEPATDFSADFSPEPEQAVEF